MDKLADSDMVRNFVDFRIPTRLPTVRPVRYPNEEPMTDSWLARLLDQFAVELEVSPFVARNSAHGIAQTMIHEGLPDAASLSLVDSLESALLDEIHALPKNMPLEGVYQIAACMFLALGRLEISEIDAGIIPLKLNLVGLERQNSKRRF